MKRIDLIVYLMTSLTFYSLTSSIVSAKSEDNIWYELPDPIYVANECMEAGQRVSAVQASATTTIKSRAEARRVGESIKALCDAAFTKAIAPDDWLAQFYPKREELAEIGRRGRYYRMHIIGPTVKSIPNNFVAYSILLFPSIEWNAESNFGNRRKLLETFTAFGESIGDQRAAIWFSGSGVSGSVDIPRSKYFADKFELDYNSGPYIVTSSKRPDSLLPGDEVVVIKLGGIQMERVVKILNLLEQDLRTGSTIKNRRLIFEEIKQRLISISDRHPDIGKEMVKGVITVLTK